jgi:hypothetical protein
MGLTAARSCAKEVVVISSDAASIRHFVIAGRTARFTVHQAIDAKAYIDRRLAQRAVFFAPATLFQLFALRADDAAYARLRGHD